MDLQAAQELMHGLSSCRSHLRAVLACPVGAAAGQEAHQYMNQGRVRHHLMSCAILRVQHTAGGCKYRHI